MAIDSIVTTFWLIEWIQSIESRRDTPLNDPLGHYKHLLHRRAIPIYKIIKPLIFATRDRAECVLKVVSIPSLLFSF